VGKEMPYGGMNEAGLVVENMYLNESIYPKSDERAAVSEVQWIQYMLDNCATVNEVIDEAEKIRIAQNTADLHYLVCDRFGKVATIEFLEGKLVYHTEESLPEKVLTNNTYDESLEFCNYGVDSLGNNSLKRFKKASSMIREFYDNDDNTTPVEYAFDILENVRKGDYTKWQIVYDVTERKIYFRTTANANIKEFSLDAFNYDCGDTPVMLSIDFDKTGSVEGDFQPYTTEANHKLMQETFRVFREEGFATGISDSMLVILSRYPEQLPCVK
jgi:choloylglycine hydrolase